MKGLLIQEFKTLFKSPAAISILLIPIVMIVGLGYLLPSAWIIPSAITIGIVGAVLLYFGGSLEEIKRTSFMKSISLTRLNKFTFLATKILFSIFISLFSVLWVLFFSWIFTEPITFLASNFSTLIPPSKPSIENLNDAVIALINSISEGADFSSLLKSGKLMDIIIYVPFKINWEKINWVAMLYAGIITIIISISIAFVFVSFSKSSLSFYLMSFGYLISMILFGGVVMPSFLIDKETNGWFTTLYYFIPNYYTNNVMATSFGSSLGQMVDNITDKIDILSENIDQVVEVISNKLSSWGDIDEGKDSFIYLIDNIVNPLIDWLGISGKIPDVLAVGGEYLWKGGLIIQLHKWWNGLWISGVAQVNHNIIISSDLPDLPDINLSKSLQNIVKDLSNNTDQIRIFIEILDQKILPKLDLMFNTAQWWDYIVPWLETAIFLGISTKFFKWS